MTDRTCFAFNKDALRCDSPAGHEGPHTLTIEWTDDDCWVPGTNEPSVTTTRITPVTYTSPVDNTPDVPMNEACVACDHMRDAHDDEVGCLIGAGGELACGCRRFV